ncbi:MAG: hypothetical protein KDA68_22620, partial [Planctomycetaceae bacterium]|nr:hypothetical protein [Planctomycetaceae bacterium]
MLTEQQIQDDIARRRKIERPYGIIGLVLSAPLIPLFIWMDKTNPGESPMVLAWAALFFMGSSCALFFIGSFRASRFKLRCPHCQCDLTCQLADLIRTHHCRTCRELIVGEIPA